MSQRPNPRNNAARRRAAQAQSNAPEARPAGHSAPAGAAAIAASRPASGTAPRPLATPRLERARRDAAPTRARRLSERRGLLLAVVAVLVVGVLGGLAGLALLRPAPAPAPITNVAGAIGWPAAPASSTLTQRLDQAGLPLLNTEGETLHIHQQLNIFVDGQQVAVPADIGIDTSTGQLSPLHTHDATGVIHVESPTVRTFTLGEFFQVWGVPLSSQCISQFCTGPGAELKTWVNGQPYSGDPSGLALAAHQVITIAYGTASQMPSQIPSTYAWNGL